MAAHPRVGAASPVGVVKRGGMNLLFDRAIFRIVFSILGDAGLVLDEECKERTSDDICDIPS